MTSNVTLDSAGRVLIPKSTREELHLVPGDMLALETDGERVTLSPVRSASAMRKEGGVWVFRSGRSVSHAETEEALQAVRRKRERSARGS
jgi:AbrB family looped-hinge helix DNA binding protein